MAQAQLWLKTLRQAVKGDYGPGWILKEQYDRFKIGRAEAGNARHGKTQFVSTTLPFARCSSPNVWEFLVGLRCAFLHIQNCSASESGSTAAANSHILCISKVAAI